MKNKIKLGVIGVGHLGQHHAKHYTKIKAVELIGVYDVDYKRSKKIAKDLKTKAYSSLDEMLNLVEGVSIVTPTKDHAKIAEMCIRLGKHVFIEKPISKTIKEADNIISLAKTHKVIVQVGHIERFNPALQPLKNYRVNPKYIEVQRLAPYMIRGTDIPVVLDLMIHDIDLVLSFIDSPVKKIEASGVSIMTNSVDIANARIDFKNGSVANITSSRVAKDKVRKIKLFQQDLYITIDFLIGLTEVYRVLDQKETVSKSTISTQIESKGKQRQIIYEKPKIKKEDALQMELINFVEAIQKKSKTIVDGVAGREALKVALQIQQKILEGLS
ncbi:Gfo/Idh/MocA family oxidoreductase [Candidatus Marinimicrobia bacterium]|nr:Gfo/Idh/MocA family oxidoreductase [Candidatus Neomarinimicrobiota bacterium]